MPVALDSASSTEYKGLIYLVGEYNTTSGRLSSVPVYNPSTSSWTQDARMKVAKSLSAVGVINCSIVVAGGLTNSGGVSTDNESFTFYQEHMDNENR